MNITCQVTRRYTISELTEEEYIQLIKGLRRLLPEDSTPAIANVLRVLEKMQRE